VAELSYPVEVHIGGLSMNSFYEHHKRSIRCFDWILLNGLIQPFQQPERVIGFFNAYRRPYPVSRGVLLASPITFSGGQRRGSRSTPFQSWTRRKANWSSRTSASRRLDRDR